MFIKGLIIVCLSTLSFKGIAQANTDTTVLNAQVFQEKLYNQKGIILDVRTPSEYKKSHINNAVNVNWNNKTTFEQYIQQISKDEPIYVYCLSGGRSKQAAQMMRSKGFKHVYELDGGIMKWPANQLSLISSDETSNNMISAASFANSIHSNKLVLVDFYAEWCGPCKKMAPILKKLSENNESLFNLLKVDADANPKLCEEQNVTAIPDMRLYKNGEIVWQTAGIISEKKLKKIIKKYAK